MIAGRTPHPPNSDFLGDEGMTAEEFFRYLDSTIQEASNQEVGQPSSGGGPAASGCGKGPNPPVPSTNSSVQCGRFPYTDLGNAERLRFHFGEDIRHCRASDSWYLYDGKRWKRDTTGKTNQMAHRVVRNIALEAAFARTSDERTRALKHALKSEDERAIKAMVNLAKDLEGIAVEPGDFDTDPYLLNCTNGTIDLRTATLQRHRREDLITRMTGAAFDEKATCPKWDRFIHQIMDGNPGLIAYLGRLFGHALVGIVIEHTLAILCGTGANGKSTLCEAIIHTLGDYAMMAPPELFLAKKFGSGHPCDLADLDGARLVIDSEAEDGARLNESRLKRLTGGDRIKARHMHQNFYQFNPTWTFVLCLNRKPVVAGDDPAIWRRLHLVPFKVTIPEKDQQKDLPVELKKEADGILAWLVLHCREWLSTGLNPPPEVRDATNAYRAEMDEVGGFVDACCEVTPSGDESAKDLYEEYSAWCKGEGREPISQTKFGKSISNRGLEKHRESKTGRIRYKGIKLKPGSRRVSCSYQSTLRDLAEPDEPPPQGYGDVAGNEDATCISQSTPPPDPTVTSPSSRGCQKTSPSSSSVVAKDEEMAARVDVETEWRSQIDAWPHPQTSDQDLSKMLEE